MKYTNIIHAHVCCLISDEGLRTAVNETLSSAYQLDSFTEIEQLLSDSAQCQNIELLLCEHALIADNESERLSQLIKSFPSCSVLVIGGAIPVAKQIEVLKYGARGYFNQSLPLEKLNEAIQLVLHGEVWVERQVISGLIDELTHVPALSVEQQAALDSLSPKELEVARLVSHGSTNKMIARTMNITERTVKAHLTTIFNKMDLPDRLSLAIFFRDLR